MARLMRGLTGLVGVLGILIMLRLWMAPVEVASQLGLMGTGPLGIASLRADIAGFFGAVGIFALMGTIRNDRIWLLTPLLLIGLALLGRFITLGQLGPHATMVPPMVAEAGLLLVLGLGWRFLGKGTVNA